MTDIQVRKSQGGFQVYNKYTGKTFGQRISHEDLAKRMRDFMDKTSDQYEGGEHMDYGKAVGAKLGYNPSKQPVSNAGKVGDKPSEGKKANDKSGMAFTTMKQKGKPSRAYSVSVVDKARAKIGGH